MKLEIKRKWLTPSSTIGDFYVDGTWECYCLENAVRPYKIPNCTAIPSGTYKVALYLWSAKASGYPLGPSAPPLYPLLQDVPNFTGIFIHCGNFPTTPTKPGDSHGCILLGKIKGPDSISQSRDAFRAFFPKICAASQAGETIEITIS